MQDTETPAVQASRLCPTHSPPALTHRAVLQAIRNSHGFPASERDVLAFVESLRAGGTALSDQVRDPLGVKQNETLTLAS